MEGENVLDTNPDILILVMLKQVYYEYKSPKIHIYVWYTTFFDVKPIVILFQ